MINVRTIRKLSENDGLTLKGGKVVTYKTGWQVADHGVECKTAHDCMIAIKEMKGDCGIWYAGGIYYVDHSFRVSTKKEALAIGRKFNQISIFGWRLGNLAYC